MAWDLLSVKSAPHRRRSVRNLDRSLGRRAADALLLRYRMGLSPQQAACAMGLKGPEFELLRIGALRRIAPHTPK
ncbi:hypothetical protein [Streptomyces sp. NPDC092903]|uniref:hypothetical protein n=1 Tax=Streptomyces sp. NPDC092903 TaxID=3366017 RepID=UPI003818BFA4